MLTNKSIALYQRRLCATLMATIFATFAAEAFQVLPKVSDVDRTLAGLGKNGFVDVLGQYVVGNALPMIKSPVHEAITLAAIGCVSAAGHERDCLTLQAVAANRIILYGVRWPDDPPFPLNRDKPPRSKSCDVQITMRSTAQPDCWYMLFKDAGALAAKAYDKNPNAPAFGPGDYLLYCSHYGDLQFLHSMATHDGELASDTRRQMKVWTKFLWGIALKELPVGKFIRNLGVDDLAVYFPGDITASNLFATGITEVRKDLDKVAIGILLHMVQDSFSQAHTERAPETGDQCVGADFDRPGQIVRFYSYAQQIGKLHDDEDTFDALGLHTAQVSPNVVDTSRAFLTLWQRTAPWIEAEKLFDCVFDLQNPAAQASPGRFVRTRH